MDKRCEAPSRAAVANAAAGVASMRNGGPRAAVLCMGLRSTELREDGLRFASSARRRLRAALPAGSRARLRRRPFPGRPWRGRAWSRRRATGRRAPTASGPRRSPCPDRTTGRACRARAPRRVARACRRCADASRRRGRERGLGLRRIGAGLSASSRWKSRSNLSAAALTLSAIESSRPRLVAERRASRRRCSRRSPRRRPPPPRPPCGRRRRRRCVVRGRMIVSSPNDLVQRLRRSRRTSATARSPRRGRCRTPLSTFDGSGL